VSAERLRRWAVYRLGGVMREEYERELRRVWQAEREAEKSGERIAQLELRIRALEKRASEAARGRQAVSDKRMIDDDFERILAAWEEPDSEHLSSYRISAHDRSLRRSEFAARVREMQRELAALREDRERLEWLQLQRGSDLRAAIDAARKETP
jgi:rhamnose utilization protein RhaD (predicted bifunctional aldolase and dehydrogenase)